MSFPVSQYAKLISEGKTFCANGLYLDAEVCFINAISIHKPTFEAFYNLALVYEKLGDLEKAMGLYTSLLETNPYKVSLKKRIEFLAGEIRENQLAIKLYNNGTFI